MGRPDVESMMSDTLYSSGDRVRHSGRPEWGVGTVVKTEQLPANGQLSQRLSIRFPNAGTKTLISGHAELQRVTDTADPFESEAPSVKDWDKMNGSDWLAPVAKRKVEEAMLSLPSEIRDPFNSMQKRLTMMLNLYRFDRSGKGLMDWAVAQTGLDDPLSRFSRQDLEQKFERWACERDSYLSKLLQEIRNGGGGGIGGNEQSILNVALKQAPPAAVETVRRLIGSR
jgi:hypothetical protein